MGFVEQLPQVNGQESLYQLETPWETESLNRLSTLLGGEDNHYLSEQVED